MKNIMVLVNVDAYEKLKILKKRTGNSFAAIIRTAIDEYLQRQTPPIQTVEQDSIDSH